MNRSVCCARNKKGFTLLEMICALAVSSIILLVASALFFQTASISKSMEAADSLYLNGSFSMDYLERELKAAVDVYGPEEAGVSITNATPIGFVLKIDEHKYVTYAKLGRTLRRYTAEELYGLQRTQGILGNNLLTENCVSASSFIDREQNVLEVSLVVENNGREQLYHRILTIPERPE